ncbi:MAG: acyl carrier protein [Rhizobiales bacterium]|nr:acyl carrier protein [Hyphomicrobiales bacterium]
MSDDKQEAPHRKRLIETFIEVFSLEPGADVAALKYRGIPAWDSIGHMQLVASIETAFDVMLETDQVIEMSSFDKALEILSANGVGVER